MLVLVVLLRLAAFGGPLVEALFCSAAAAQDSAIASLESSLLVVAVAAVLPELADLEAAALKKLFKFL